MFLRPGNSYPHMQTLDLGLCAQAGAWVLGTSVGAPREQKALGQLRQDLPAFLISQHAHRNQLLAQDQWPHYTHIEENTISRYLELDSGTGCCWENLGLCESEGLRMWANWDQAQLCPSPSLC